MNKQDVHMPKLTIITINYNHLDGLRRTIDSIVNQTFADYEWIVVDGGSSDGSRELLEQYQNSFAWWCSEPDKGVYNAMNKGLVHATGEYVNFMNSGDVFASDTILSEIFSKTHTADILYGIMTRGALNGEINNKFMMKPEIGRWDFYFSTFNHQATFTRLKLYNSYGFYDESYRAVADWRHFAELVVIRGVSCEYIPQKVAIYEGGGISEDRNIYPQEIQRLRNEVFPTICRRDLVELCYVDICNSNRISAILYYLLTRGTKWILKKMHKSVVTYDDGII